MFDTEAAFQSALDANPSHSAIRGVFADWLEEQDDPRADGMRWLFWTGKYPERIPFGIGNHVLIGMPLHDVKWHGCMGGEDYRKANATTLLPEPFRKMVHGYSCSQCELKFSTDFAALPAAERERLLAEAQAEYEARHEAASVAARG